MKPRAPRPPTPAIFSATGNRSRRCHFERRCRSALPPPCQSLRRSPPRSTVRAKLLQRMAKLLPEQESASHETQVASYQSSRRHRALAALPPSRSWRTAGWDTAAVAEERALEGCQVRHGAACVLVAVNDTVIDADAATPRAMARVSYKGVFDPDRIPAVTEALRKRADIVGYRDSQGAKAAAFSCCGPAGNGNRRRQSARCRSTCARRL